MKVIWKFGLDIAPGGRCTVAMPRDRELLSFGDQRGQIVAWAAVDPESGPEDVVFAVAGTGWDVPDGVYRATVQMFDGFVWHVFEQAGEGDTDG